MFKDKLQNIKATQVLATGIKVDNLVAKKFLDELKELFPDAELEVSGLEIQVLPKTDDKKKPTGELKTAATITIEHPSKGHRKDLVIALTSTNATVIERLIGAKGAKKKAK